LLSGRSLVRGPRCRVRDRPSRRGRSAVTARCVARAASTTSSSHASSSAALSVLLANSIRLHGTRPSLSSRRDSAPGNTACSTHSPTTRPAQTGPLAKGMAPRWADFRRVIFLGVNLCKGVYQVRQLTPSVPTYCSAALPKQQRTKKKIASTAPRVSPAQDQGTCAGRSDC